MASPASLGQRAAVLIRRETPADHDAVDAVTAAAFDRGDGARAEEADLTRALRADAGFVPRLSLVADDAGEVVGHVICTRGDVAGRPVLGLGPLAVRPDRQRGGVGSALVHAVLGAADALDEPLVALLGDPAYYSRFGFVLAATVGIVPPDPAWAPAFQVRTLAAYDPGLRGPFTYAAPFS